MSVFPAPLVEPRRLWQAFRRTTPVSMRAIIADDHPLYREAVRLRLERSFPSAEIAEVGGVDELLRIGPAAGKLDLHLVKFTRGIAVR